MLTIFGQTKQDKYSTGTYDGVFVNVRMVHGTANTAIAQSDLNPAMIGIKATLKRGNVSRQLFGDNLLILGTYNTLKEGYHEFSKGLDIAYPAAGVFATKLRTVFIKFGGAIRIAPGEELIIECSPSASGAISTNINSVTSNVEFYANPCIGYEAGVYETKVEIIQANATNHPQSLGDNVTHIAVINFDKTDITAQVLKNISLTSDKLDVTYTFDQLLAMQAKMRPVGRQRYGTSLPLGASTETVYRGLNYLPQSFEIFDGTKDSELDGVRLQLLLEGANVTASNNYVVYQTYTLTKEQLEESLQRQAKHVKENVQKVVANS